MAETISEPAPAKVNLALHVTGRRDDGYHLLDTLVAFTRAGDRVSVRPAHSDALAVSGPFADGLPTDGSNLVVRARDMLRALVGSDAFPVAILLEKNLPVASGIGGGSSDAAATLRALVRLWGAALATDKLAAAALALGADLPMCLAAPRPLLARGIGEALTPVEGLPGLDIVLANPGVAVATPSVFRALARRDNPPLAPLPERPGIAAFVDWLARTRNDLETPALSVAPALSSCLAALRGNGALLARMSGSGATCFGIFVSRQDAAQAATAIAAAYPSWYIEATHTTEGTGHADGAY